MEFFSALLAIVVIDLVLAGDNAIVIGLAARNLPKHQQKKVIIWGTVGAIVVRSLLTLVVVWLLLVPGLRLIGGLLLIWIAYKLLIEDKEDESVQSGVSIWAAVRTIIIADTAMGLDNVLAVAGAAHGDFLLVVIGLLISIPIVVWGSTLILKLIEKYPIIITIGAGVLAWTASKMIVEEPFIHTFFAEHQVLKWIFELIIIALVIAAGRVTKQKNIEKQVEKAS
jgi:YjbE family integral membrane protein